MAGTLFGIGLSQQHDVNGVPMSGCLLYLYEANSSIPVIAYRDTGLTAGQELPWPVEADSNGRIPAFWLPDGSYRARLTDSSGVVQFDELNILALGPSSGGGGGGSPADPNSLATTGDVWWRPVNTTRTGWVRLNGRTLGNSTSGATERANADTQSLYEYLWASFSDTLCPVVTGRGASAALDYTASKAITLLDMRGRGAFGLDDMGASAAGVFSGITFDVGASTTGGSSGGDATHTLTTAQIPAHTHTLTDPGHTHTFTNNPSSGTEGGAAGNATRNIDVSANTGSSTTGVTIASAGGGAGHPTISPFLLGTWYMRL
jgi:microcystin-dependent protein